MQRRRALAAAIVLVLSVISIGCISGTSDVDGPLTRKMVLAGRVGDSWYVLSQALAHFVSEQSDWLRLEVVATPGVRAGAEIASGDHERYIFISSYYDMKLNPTSKQLGNYDKERIIGFATANVWTWVTYDDELAPARSLRGKKVFLGRPGGSRTFFESAVLEQLGATDDVELLRGGYAGATNALRDGLADVAAMTIDYVFPAGFRKGALIEELETRRPVYYLDLMPPALQHEVGMLPVTIRAGALDEKTQKKAVYASIDPIYWCADARQDPAVVREIARILYENADGFAGWHAEGAGISRESIPTWIISKERMHPAALSFYAEQGIEVRPLGDLLPRT